MLFNPKRSWLDDLEHLVEVLGGAVYAAIIATFLGLWVVALYALF